ncbi:hypothetical protein HXD91_13185 [Listeria monocytogenes]|nr:hypothetical protein [Listeria monocytogenes]HAM1442261.1 hypothetical protein [Listeria monocytogenes]HEM1242134.1 hypothetical protein [Listeria monocytogenes]
MTRYFIFNFKIIFNRTIVTNCKSTTVCPAFLLFQCNNLPFFKT